MLSPLLPPYGKIKVKTTLTPVLQIVPTGKKNKKLRVIYISKKLSSKFKDKAKLKHIHNIVYHGKCHGKSCSS